VWPLVGALALVSGLALARLAPEAGGFGWFAYTPLSSERPGVILDFVLVSRAQLAGFLLAALGVVVLAGWVGYRLGRRGRREPGGR